MKRLSGFVLIAFFAALGAGTVVAEDHPRLFVNGERIQTIREQIEIEGSHRQRAYAAMKQRVANEDIATAYGGPRSGYAPGYRAREAAFLSLIAQNEAEQKRYADLAFEEIMSWSAGKTSLKGAMFSLCMALTYDWACPHWSNEQKQKARGAIDKMLVHWPGANHANVKPPYTSNFTGVWRGSEMLLMLAVGKPTDDPRFAEIKGHLLEHMKNGYGSLGISGEGVGYTEYPGAFLLPACFAAADHGDDDLLKQARKHAWWRLAMYSHSFQEHERKFVQTGVSHTAGPDEGWASLLLNLCPEDELPHLLWWYDRHMGRLAPGTIMDKFEKHRGAAVWSMIYYPETVTAADPTGIIPVGIEDDRGYCFFRNRWQDENDIQLTLMADTERHKGWDQPEALAINVMGWNSRFIGGPGKSRSPLKYSALLVDGQRLAKVAKGERAPVTGEKVAFAADMKGGYAIVSGGAQYKALGVKDARRHLMVDFSLPNGAALFATLDEIESDSSHVYTWQANLGDESGDDGTLVYSGKESGRQTFLMVGRSGWVKGWLLHPADATVTDYADPFLVDIEGRNAKIWIAMLSGSGTAPEGQVRGEGMKSVLTVAGRELRYDGKRIASSTVRHQPSTIHSSPDPRPHILILGADNSIPYHKELSWAGMAAADHPEWRVTVRARKGWVLPEMRAELDAILKGNEDATVVVIQSGTVDASVEAYAKHDAGALGDVMADLISDLNGKLPGAKVAVMTPIPVVRFRGGGDRFSALGEGRCRAIGNVYRRVAREHGAAVIDVYTYCWEMDRDPRKADSRRENPGFLLGRTGWRLRDWGTEMLAPWVGRRLETLRPRPVDPVGFRGWRDAFDAERRAAAEAGGGLVNHGPAFEALGEQEARVPAKSLEGASLNLLVKSVKGGASIIACGSDRYAYKNKGLPDPILTVETDAGEVEIAPHRGNWQLIRENTPDEPVSTYDYPYRGAHIMLYPASLSAKEGEQRWCLVRFPLDALAGKRIRGATVAFPKTFAGGHGTVTIHPVLGGDANWHPMKATWNTRDGKTPWTGKSREAADG